MPYIVFVWEDQSYKECICHDHNLINTKMFTTSINLHKSNTFRTKDNNKSIE